MRTLLIAEQAKRLRARIIADYMNAAGIERCLCFSCGNASRALKQVLPPSAVLEPAVNGKWWTVEEIAQTWPEHFDATSGHLSVPLMAKLAQCLKRECGVLHGDHQVPTGSGETLLALSIAYPDVRFIPVQDGSKSTEWHEQSPLYSFIQSRRL